MQYSVERIARLMAMLGGLVLTALVLLTCVSVLGRGLNTLGHSGLLPEGLGTWLIASGVGPVNGDFELVESGIAFTIFAFLPICQYYGAHATVDIFTASLPLRANRWLMAFWEVMMGIVMILIAVRLFAGMMDKVRYGETTFLLQYPVWWSYAASLVAAVIAALVSIYCAAARLFEAVTRRRVLPFSEGADH